MHTSTYFAYFAYLYDSWAHSVLQLCAEKTVSKPSALSKAVFIDRLNFGGNLAATKICKLANFRPSNGQGLKVLNLLSVR